MATYNSKDKEKLSLVEQIAQKNPSNLVVKQPTNFGVAQLHNTGAAPGATNTTPEGFEGSAKSVYTHNDSQSGITDEMNANSKLWWDAKAAGDTDMMKSLEAANKQLAALLGDGVTYDSSTGTWSGVANMPATKQAAMITGVDPQMPTYDYDAWMQENPAPTFQSAYNAKIDELMNAMLNREKFSYDAESDPLYQQYKSMYTREGNRSMNDTLVAAASGAGGMSSYAMTAAQQANNYYMAQLGDKIPELQQLAYEMYMNDLGQQRQDIGMLMDKDSVDYGRFRDSMSDWNNDRNFAYGQYRDQMGDYQWGTEFNYGAYRDQVADDRYKSEWKHALERETIEDEWRKKEWDYGVGRDQVEDAWREKQWDYGVSRDGIEDAFREKQFNYGVSQDQQDNEFREKQFNYGVTQDAIQNGRYNRDDAYDRAMEMISMGAMPSDSILALAGLTKREATEMLNGGFIDSGSSGGDDPFWASINALGIGPKDATYINMLKSYGLIVENDDETVAWASGVNNKNYLEKLDEAKKRNPGAGVFQAYLD